MSKMVKPMVAPDTNGIVLRSPLLAPDEIIIILTGPGDIDIARENPHIAKKSDIPRSQFDKGKILNWIY